MEIGDVGIWVSQDSLQEKELFYLSNSIQEIQLSYVLIFSADIDNSYECLASVTQKSSCLGCQAQKQIAHSTKSDQPYSEMSVVS